MKTALGYLFLGIAAMIAGLLLFSVIYAATGRLGDLLAMQKYTPKNWLQITIFWAFHIAAAIPLAYYGFKWIKREENYTVPPSGNSI
jgi:hypothetical protein